MGIYFSHCWPILYTGEADVSRFGNAIAVRSNRVLQAAEKFLLIGHVGDCMGSPACGMMRIEERGGLIHHGL